MKDGICLWQQGSKGKRIGVKDKGCVVPVTNALFMAFPMGGIIALLTCNHGYFN